MTDTACVPKLCHARKGRGLRKATRLSPPPRNYAASSLSSSFRSFDRTCMPPYSSLRGWSRRFFDSLRRSASSLSQRRTSRSLAQLARATAPSFPTAGPEMLKSYGNFDLVRRDVLGFSDITVSRWRSRESGLTVIHLDYEGASALTLWRRILGFSTIHAAPIVKGYFTVGTESEHTIQALASGR